MVGMETFNYKSNTSLTLVLNSAFVKIPRSLVTLRLPIPIYLFSSIIIHHLYFDQSFLIIIPCHHLLCLDGNANGLALQHFCFNCFHLATWWRWNLKAQARWWNWYYFINIFTYCLRSVRPRYNRWSRGIINHTLLCFENIPSGMSICCFWFCQHIFILQYNLFVPLLIGCLGLQLFQIILEWSFKVSSYYMSLREIVL